MNAWQSDTPISAEPFGLSRRAVLSVSATGLAIALFAHGVEAVEAQESTPAAEGGLPPGIGLNPLITVPLDDLPSGRVMLELMQLTLEPGATSPATSSHGVLEVGYTQAGTLICPGGEGRVVYGPDGTETASGAGDLEVPTGSAIMVPPDALDGARNDGAEQVRVLLIHFGPAEETATPTM